MTPADWQHGGTYMKYRSGPIFVRQSEADRPVLLLIHGFPTASWDWSRIWPLLGEHYRLLAIDMLGFGFSAKPLPYRYTIFEQADIHREVLAGMGITEVHILAHDYGDTVAQELIARQLRDKLPCRLLSVAFLNGGLFPGVHRPRPIQKLLMSPLGKWLTPFLGRANLARTFRRIFGPDTQPTETDIDHFWELIIYNDGKPAIPRLIKYMQERIQHEQRWVGALREANIPLLLINGAADPISGAHLATHFRKILPERPVVEMPDIGHYPQWEAPHRTAEHYLSFRNLLDEQSAG